MSAMSRADGFPAVTIAQMARALRYFDEARFEWAGKLFEAAPGSSGREKDLPPAVREVTYRLYERFYCTPDAGRGSYAVLTDDTLRREHLVKLDEANATPWGWQDDWQVVSLTRSRLVVRSSGSGTRTVGPDEFDGSPEPGSVGRLRLRKGSGKIQPGWYHVRGETDHHAGETLRVYWNVSVAGGVPLVRSLTRALNDARIPFHFKIQSDPERYTRADVAVLYLPAASWEKAKEPIRGTYAAVSLWAKRATPLFARRLARGLAAAEDTPGDSFGLDRSRRVARFLWDAHNEGIRPIEEQVERVRDGFRREGFDPERLYLQPRSRRSLDLDVEDLVLPLAGRRVA